MTSSPARIEPENRRGRNSLACISHGIVRDGEYAEPLIDEDTRLAVHAGLEQPLAVVERNEHGEHGDVLLDHRLRLDLFHDTREGAVWARVAHDGGRLPRTPLTDVGLVEQRTHADATEVRHLEQR